MKIGFTGTRLGMTQNQIGLVMTFLRERRDRIEEVHHGDCTGADEEFHQLVRSLVPGAKIVVHPPVDERHRAWCQEGEMRTAREYLDRNRDIVLECTVLLAAPRTAAMQQRSGTWATVRFALEIKRTLRVFAP